MCAYSPVICCSNRSSFEQLYDRRKKHAIGQEVSVMQSRGEEYMTDEETDSDDDTTLVKHSLPWRSTKCERFLKTLDDRYMESREKRNNSKPLTPRKVGPDSERHKMPSLGLYGRVLTPITNLRVIMRGMDKVPVLQHLTLPLLILVSLW